MTRALRIRRRASREPRRRAAVEPRAAPTRASAGRRDLGPILAFALPAAAALALYVATAARDIVAGDTPELITVALTLGVAHPPGYPLVTMLGALFGLLPTDPIPFRVNLLAAVCHAATVGVVGLTGHRLTRSWAAAAVGALALASSPLFWRWSLVAETFPLNDLLAALLLYALVSWHEEPTRSRWLVAAGLVAGLGLANQQTIVLLAPAAAYLVWRRRAHLDAAVVRRAAIALGSGLLPYLYVPLAAGHGAYLNWGDISSPLDFVGHLARADYGTTQLVAESSGRGGDPALRLLALGGSFSPVQGLLVLAGAVAASLGRRWVFWTALLAFGATGIAFTMYSGANVAVLTSRLLLERFFLLPQVATAPLAALGVAYLATLPSRVVPARALRGAVVAVLAAATLAQTVPAWSTIDRSADRTAREFAEDVLASLEPGTIFLAAGDHVVLPIAYLQAVEGRRPDVTLVITPLLRAEWYRRQLRRRDDRLALPAIRYEAPDALRRLVEANPARPIAMSGEEPGQTFGGAYGTLPLGLALKVVPAGTQLEIGALASELDAAYGRWRVATVQTVDRNSFDRFIVTWYALPAYRLGRAYESAKRPDDARLWYGRALSIDPELSEARDALRRLPK